MIPRSSSALVVALATVLLAGCGLDASVRNHVRDNYRFEREERTREGRSLVYRSDQPPTRTAAEIAGARPPADRRNTASGVFLRYSKDFVGVVPDGRGGSRIMVDDERRGYSHFYPYVGGFWGTYSGPGESFRGGGPGGGK